MLIRFVIALGLIAIGTLLLEVLRRIIAKTVNNSIYKELHRENIVRNIDNRSHILSDTLTELEKESVNKLIELNILLFEKNKNENVTVGECLDNAENGKFAIVNAGKVIGFTV